MAGDLARWRTPLLLVGAGISLVAVAVFALQPAKVAPPAAPSVSVVAVASTSAPVVVTPPIVAVTASAPSAASSVHFDADAGVYLIDLADGTQMPLPPGVTSASIAPQAPAELPQTPEWKLEKTKRIYAVVDERSKRLDKEAEEAEKAGDPQKAKDKRILAQRLRKQLESMGTEMKGYQDQLDGGKP